jgi:hypothetical protein
MPNPDLDALGLVASRMASNVRFGPADVSTGVATVNIISAINGLPSTELRIDLTCTPVTPDHFAGISVAVEFAGKHHQRFTGTVVSASLEDGGVAVKGTGAASLAEGMIGGFTVRGVSAPELVYTLARTGGMREEQIQVEGLASLAQETFEVVAPLDGVSVQRAVDFAGVRFIPPQAAARILAGLELTPELDARFQAPVYALALVTSQRVMQAEEEGLARIDLALAWLTARLRYGFAVLPDGRPLNFDRRESFARPLRRDVVAVRGLTTTRQWLRVPGVTPEPHTVNLDPDSARLQPHLPGLGLKDRYAFLALARAAREVDPVNRLLALWEAIEFYVGDTKADSPLFTDQEHRAISNAASVSFKGLQGGRIKNVLAMLNNPPLKERLKIALSRDAVVISKGEMDLLWKLRGMRNAIVHGQDIAIPEAEDVDFATSIVARMLVFRASRFAEENEPCAP